MIPRGWGCWTDRVDMDSSLSSAGQTAVDHAILQSTDGIQKGKSQSVYHNHTWLSPWWSSQFCSPSSSTYQWSGKKRGNTQGPYTESHNVLSVKLWQKKLPGRAWTTLPIKGQIENILTFVGCMGSTVTAQLCHCSTKAARNNGYKWV